jgi:hypothetical protein
VLFIAIVIFKIYFLTIFILKLTPFFAREFLLRLAPFFILSKIHSLASASKTLCNCLLIAWSYRSRGFMGDASDFKVGVNLADNISSF